MKSIRIQLIVYLVVGVAALVIGAGAGLFGYVDEALEHSLDAGLLAQAQAIAAAVRMDDGQLQLQGAAADFAAAVHHDSPVYFQIWRADGSTLVRVAPPGNNTDPLPRLDARHKRFGDVILPGKVDGRAAEISFLPHVNQNPNNATPQPAQASQTLTLVVVSDRKSIDQSLEILLSGLVLEGLIVTFGIVGIVTFAVRRGLRPLRALADQVEQIGPKTLALRFSADAAPPEIQPIARQLNHLLMRLQEAFERERRFSADIAHEFRTPLCELRSVCEVALRFPDDRAAAGAVAESLAIAKQMEQIIGSLLSLVRVQSGLEELQVEEVDAVDVLTAAWRPLENSALAKRLRIDFPPPAACRVQTDPRMLTQVLRNLLANAIQHTFAGGQISISASRTSARVVIAIANTNSLLTPEDLGDMTKPFWRKDSARTDGLSSGLGLAIVEEYCRALHASLNLSLPRPDWLSCTVEFEVDPQDESDVSRQSDRSTVRTGQSNAVPVPAS